MSQPIVREPRPKRDWKLSSSAFGCLLQWLDEGTDSEGQKFLEMRRCLISYFDRKNCLAPDDLTDETLNRVARRLEEEGVIESETPARYCYIVARFVFMEYLRATQRDRAALDELNKQSVGNSAHESETDEMKVTMLDCLEQCSGKLESANRCRKGIRSI